MTRLNRTQFSQQLIEFKTIAEDARSSNNPYVTPLFDLSEKYLRKWTSLPINCPLNTICSLKMQLLLEMGGILKESSQNGSSSSPITKRAECWLGKYGVRSISQTRSHTESVFENHPHLLELNNILSRAPTQNDLFSAALKSVFNAFKNELRNPQDTELAIPHLISLMKEHLVESIYSQPLDNTPLLGSDGSIYREDVLEDYYGDLNSLPFTVSPHLTAIEILHWVKQTNHSPFSSNSNSWEEKIRTAPKESSSKLSPEEEKAEQDIRDNAARFDAERKASSEIFKGKLNDFSKKSADKLNKEMEKLDKNRQDRLKAFKETISSVRKQDWAEHKKILTDSANLVQEYDRLSKEITDFANESEFTKNAIFAAQSKKEGLENKLRAVDEAVKKKRKKEERLNSLLALASIAATVGIDIATGGSVTAALTAFVPNGGGLGLKLTMKV